MQNAAGAKFGFWAAVVLGFVALLIPLLMWGNDPVDTGWYFYLVIALVVALGFFFYEEWKRLPIGMWLGSMGYVAFTVIALPRSEATAWWQMSVFIMTLGIVPLYLLVAIGRGLRTTWNAKHSETNNQ